MKILPHLHIPASSEDIVKDQAVLSTKKKMMGSLRWNSLLNSFSTVGALVGGPLLAAGMMGVAKTIFAESAVIAGGSAVTATGAAAAVGTGAFATIGGLPVVALLAVGALFVGLSVAAAYTASRIWHSKQFDNFEVNAASTAHHLVKELKANDMCLTTEHAARADGKSWTEYTKSRESVTQEAVQR